MARVYQRNNHWWADFQLGDKRYRRQMDAPATMLRKALNNVPDFLLTKAIYNRGPGPLTW